ncbi:MULTISPECIES: hypothetical protein [Pseudomonas]|uniref:Uncharacterized protein n=1 Tax=Pseudomonas donghuensis TaxID=1163398 RepID=A0AAP0SFH8_9PSED|nr:MULTISPECIES: hypothetical protein [Pseudomonas]MDF9892993.1 hypothetical protein [Pseudomonas vranovensis]KDN98791.1 hypothetical protein BV82_3519 [Pseudomonas donghuensis]MBF4207087.1 hypothetical protein [Pseudomonas donghuensis]MBS7600645.1 hypothetical protein [Pseudomonas sp. RC2C2]MCP6690932.1 hypothetical protein [Pseudomonas donghuensis]
MWKQLLSQSRQSQLKPGLIMAGKVALTLASLGTAHYMGFIMAVPFEVLSIISITFLVGFVGVFTFYVTLCYLVAKVFSFAISQFYYSFIAPFAACVYAAGRIKPGRLRKAAVRLHKETPLAEKIAYGLVMVIAFPLLLNFSYLKFDFSDAGGMVISLTLGIIAAAILKSGILIRGKAQIARIRDKRRVALRRRLLKEYLYLVVGMLLCLSFYAGMVRFQKVLGEDQIHLSGHGYTGDVHVIFNSAGAYLAIEDSGRERVFIYVDGDVSMRVKGQLRGSSEGQAAAPASADE